MKLFDVFNGDADGICALHQMRLAQPAETELVTGVKRDISLVKNVDAKEGDKVLVLDISLAKNIKAVEKLLARGCQIQYFDHHLPGELPESSLFSSVIDTSSDTCTSLLVNEHLNQQYVLWAIVAAYGDNMLASAERLADLNGLSLEQKTQLNELGVFINYNGYGALLSDLHFEPAQLYQAIKPYADPFDFISNESVFKDLKTGYLQDMSNAESLQPDISTSKTAIFILPAEKWCRRVSGVLGNDLSNKFPDRAHALLTVIEGGYQVSVRAPQTNKKGAGDLCSQFDSGGGREGAAGINLLQESDKQRFIDSFIHQYSRTAI